ncbi:MAG: hypothetical protein OXI69_05460 [Acidobacteriota bacterium]|nr:hypothetical protein [Acidobacteriota bacterium]
MSRSENSKLGATRPGSPTALTDEDINTVRVDRRSFLSRAVAAGSIAAAAAMAAACASGTDSDGEGDAGAPPADSDQETEADQATDSDRQQ